MQPTCWRWNAKLPGFSMKFWEGENSHGQEPYYRIKEQFRFRPYSVENEGVEYWMARDLMPLLGYQRWENFEIAIHRAMTSCENSGVPVQINFVASRN
jgi:hypothetical protein